MAISYLRQTDIPKGQLFIDEDEDGAGIYVVYQPSIERLKQAGKNLDDITLYREELLWIGVNTIVIYPLNTYSTTANFMQPKYSNIQSIILHNFFFQIPETIEDIENILKEKLPEGFVKDYDSGLGLLKSYDFIIQSLEENKEITKLKICNCPSCKTMLDEDCYSLNIRDYNAIIKGIKKIDNEFQSKRKVDKFNFAYNTLLNTINPNQYPKKNAPYKKDSVLEFISSNDIQLANLSAADLKGTVNLVCKNTKNIVKQDPTVLMKLRNDIELVTLENIIEHFEKMLTQNFPEERWQKFFDDNSFILSMVFGCPSVKVLREARVGFGDISGAGDKFTDFLFKNKSTNNSAIIEIKKPNTSLLNKSPYRDSKAYIGDVYSVTRELSGAMNQILDQKYKFQQDIGRLHPNPEKHNFESYSINCLLIIGRTPEDKEQKRFFELFRGNSKDIEIITFDELLEKLKLLYSFLSSKKEDVKIVSEKPNLSSNEKPNFKPILNPAPNYDEFDDDVPF